MRILSLFDGMACGMIAMQLAGVEVESYDAYEIDKYAVKTAQHNFPMIQEHGDVFAADFTQYDGVDFLVGGSPCTYWSIAQTKNRETVASGMGWELFSQYVRALREAKPKYFIYENNKSMSKQIRASIDEAFGFEAVLINSALVSAQNRQRLYWVGKRNANGTYSKVNVEQPEDRGILLKDVLDSAVAWREKSHTIDANYYKGGNFTSPNKQSGQRLMAAEPVGISQSGKAHVLTTTYWNAVLHDTIEKHRRSLVAEPVNITADGKSQTIKAQYQQTSPANICCYTSTYGATGVAEPICVAQRGRMYRGEAQHYEARDDGKTNTLTSVEKDNRVAEPVACRCRGRIDESGNGYAKYECRDDGKANALDTNTVNGAMVSVPVRCMNYELKEAYDSDSGCVARLDMPKCHDILTRVYGWNGKCPTVTAHGGGNTEPKVFDHLERIVPAMPVAEPVCLRYERTEDAKRCRKAYERHEIHHGYNELNELHPRPDGKTNTLTTVQKDNQIAIPVHIPMIEFDDAGNPISVKLANGKKANVYQVYDGEIYINGKCYPIKLRDGFYIIRKLTVTECKRLQTVPEWYDFSCVSNSQAYKMLGNGWTCEVIKHLIQSCLNEKETDFDEQCKLF